MKKLLISGFAVLAVLAPFGPVCFGWRRLRAYQDCRCKLTSVRLLRPVANHAVGQFTAEERLPALPSWVFPLKSARNFAKEAGYEIVQVSVQGRPVSAARNTIKSTLTSLRRGKVGRISHQDGLAVV
jgi:hypothetical protein